jgi:putative MATE family efflux protein
VKKLYSHIESCKTNADTIEIDRSTIRKNIISLAWPSVTELILVTLCEMIDMMMVGKLGPYAITAVGLTSQPKFVMLSVFLALNVGVTALVARLKGENNVKEANAVVRQALVLSLLFAILVSILGVIFSKNMIVLMGGEPDTIQPGTDYFRILMGGFIFTAISLCISAALRGAGNTRAAMRFNITANVINVVFNYLLIYGKFGFPALGVSGAAIATIIGWSAASIMALITIIRGDNYIFISLKDNYKPNLKIIKRIVRIGLPAAGEQFALRAGLLLYVRTVSSLGTVVYATHQISINILGLSFMNGQAFGIAATSLIGQSLGQKRPDLAKTYAIETRRLGSLVSTLIATCFFFFGEQLVSLYTSNAEIIKSGGVVLKIVALLQPFQSSFLILSGALRGAGDTRWPAISTFIGVLIIRPILSFICVLIFHWGLIGAWVALVSDQLLRFVLVYFRFLSGKWTTIKV